MIPNSSKYPPLPSVPKGSLKVICRDFRATDLERVNKKPYLHVGDVVAVPRSTEEFIPKSQDEDVFDHLLTKIVVDTENLLLLPIRF